MNFQELIKRRQSVRKYTDKPVEKDKIENIETSKYYKKVIEPTEDEIKLHKEYLKNSLKRNYFN